MWLYDGSDPYVSLLPHLAWVLRIGQDEVVENRWIRTIEYLD